MIEKLKQQIANRLVFVFVCALVLTVGPAAAEGYQAGGIIAAVHDSIATIQYMIHDLIGA